MEQQPTTNTVVNAPPSSRKGKGKGGNTTQQKKRFEKQIQQIIRQQKWNLSCKRFTPSELEQFITTTTDHHHVASMLWLHWNQDANIINTIVPFAFSKLQVLNLGGNLIESVENLQLSQFQSLLELWLWNNKIVRIDCLRKCHFPRLKFLDVSQNLILQCTKLYELKAPLLERINIENNQFISLNPFVKHFAASVKPFKVLFMKNSLINAFGQPLKRGKRTMNQVIYRPQSPSSLEFS